MKIRHAFLVPLVIFAAASIAAAGDLVVHLPIGITPKSAAALAPASEPGTDGPAVAGKIDGQVITYSGLKPATQYDLKIALDNGTVLHGVNMSWYTREPARVDAEPINDDDRKQIGTLVADVKSFYNISRIITLSGDHNRATVLVERIRSTDFHSDSGGEVIWRVELWYFVNDFGGWAEEPQTNKVLRRERYKTNAEYRAQAAPLRWILILGGITLDKSGAKSEIFVPADALIAATQPAN